MIWQALGAQMRQHWIAEFCVECCVIVRIVTESASKGFQQCASPCRRRTGEGDAFAAATTAAAIAAEIFIGVFAALITAHDMELAAGMNRRVTLRDGRVVELE